MVPGTTTHEPTSLSFLTIIRLSTFERSARGLLSEQDNASLDELLANHPEAGALIRGTGGVRKLRVRLAGRGKSGGARVIYYHHGAKQRVYLILAYAKSAKDTLGGREKQQMRKLTAVLENET